MKFLFIVILLIPFVNAKTGKMSLLTVGGPEETSGGIADLFLEVKPGNGRIFIDSFPLTKLDTQISTRFANEIACDFLKEDCSKYDFFYTIRAKATIVGGPSAGAATTILTIGVLSNLKLNEQTIISGTINSGGLIGPVAKINEKTNAAINNGFTKIIIPKWQSSLNTTKIKEKKLSEKITIVKVKNLEEALYHFTGKDFSKKNLAVAVSKEYSNKMKEVADILCKRSVTILNNVNKSNSSFYIIAENFLNKSEDADINNDYYSKASFCFSANLRLRDLELVGKNPEELQKIFVDTKDDFETIKESTDKKELASLSDLESHIIVNERLSEAEIYLDRINEENISSSELAYAKERLFSAEAWSEFFNLKGKRIQLNKEHLKIGCLKKIAEAEERINYVELYITGVLEASKTEIKNAIDNYNQEEFAVCIFKASKAKAEANILLTGLSIGEDEIEQVVEEKFEAIKKIILQQDAKELFPILGYSYFEYAKSLVDYNIVSSLTFAEYALELSRLDMYFPDKKKISFTIDSKGFQIFLFGFITGASIIMLINIKKKRLKR